MADGYRLPQQSAGNFFHPQPNQRHLARRNSAQNNIRSGFSIENLSPSRSPDRSSPGQNSYGMFGHGHQQGNHGRVNGGLTGHRMPMIYNFQHQNTHQQQPHTQIHQNLQQDHSVHSVSSSVIGHPSGYSSSVLSNATTNFTPGSMSNGIPSTTRGGQAQQITEHWADQLKLYKETEKAHAIMIEQHAPNHYARARGQDNRPIPSQITASNLAINSAQDEIEDRGRPSNIEGSVKRQDWHSIDMSGQGLRVLAPPLFAYTFLNELYLGSNNISQLSAAIGQLRQLRYLDASNNALTELPPELGMCVYLKNLIMFDNDIRTLPNELGSLYQLEMFGVEGNRHFDPRMKQEIVERGTKSLISHLREQAPVPLSPATRVMLDLQDGAPVPANQERFKVFSYNTLCDKYATNQQYGYTPAGALTWDYRKELILQEIQASEADFLCLQEVDTDSFNEFFSMKLAYKDYKGVFWPKSRARTMSEKDAKVVDGCATFYKGSKYILLDKQLVDFANIAINRPDMKNQHDIFNRVMPRDNIAIITFFENRLTGGRIIVVNAHIFYDPAFADVKVIQTAILMESVTKLADKYARWPACKDKKTYTFTEEHDGESKTPKEPAPEPAPSMEYTSSTQLPLLVCGDFNSTQDSGVYELLDHGSVPPDHADLGNHEYGNFTRDGIQHPFALRSAYSSLDGSPEAVPFTDYTPGFTDVIDYIWYSTNAMEVTALLGPVDPEYMRLVPGFPNYHFPSDHISLLAEFSVKTRKEKKVHPEPDFGPSRERRK